MTVSLAEIPGPRLLPFPTGKSLFSRHYLETHLPRHPEWVEDPMPAFARLAELWERGRRLGATWNEHQTETEFLRPALDALGWTFIPQAPATRGRRLSRPDYALFLDAATRDQAYPLQGQDDAFYGRAGAIAEAKHWDRPLSRQNTDGRERWDADANPSHQMVNYLVGTRCPWGILTNGRIWRLYSREVSSTASEFYEVDLAAIFEEDAPLHVGAGLPFAAASYAPPHKPAPTDAFKLWWFFFRRDAFVPDAQGHNFVRRVAAGSASYAREVSDKLKDLVFRQVMPEVAAGFIAYRRERLGIAQESDATLAEIYRASLGLLYKLLFILYAEARGLLPVDHPAYQEESLTRMAADFADKLDRGLPLSDATHAARQYDSLLALFHRIDLGDPALGIPRYDGGLFNPATPENRFLETHKLSDRAVARAVDTLVRDAGQPVDYGYISVRNLGSIYEGLLENRLTVVELPSLRRDGNSTTAEVLLVNDRGERKATGSYYTPDYIVDYIVRQTLGPVLEERQGVFEAAMARCAELRGRLAKTLDAGANRQLRGQLEAAESAAREAFLGIKVCDPAMGSGHFLVNAVDFLADGIIQRMQAYHDSHPDVPWEWNPIRGMVERVRRDITVEMARQGISLDPARLDDTGLLTRLVMKRCIYGVDLNPMAVELAKLSLWLHSFTVGAPLSFLDHHLRWGNSLIGVDVRTVEAAIATTDSGQMALWGGPFAGLLDLTAVMTEVAGRADATLADVRQSADEFARFQRELIPYKQTLDLWVSQYFDEERPLRFQKPQRSGAALELLTVHAADVLPALRGERALAEKYRAAIAEARRLWEEKRFFHWDLEFPEVFVDLGRRDWAENPGFDAVIGNPPWVDAWTTSPLEQNERESVYLVWKSRAQLDAHWDMYIPFIYQALSLIRRQGLHSFVLPSPFATEQYAEAIRMHIADNFRIAFFVDFGARLVFPGVSRKVVIEGVQRQAPAEDALVKVHDPDSVVRGDAVVSHSVPQVLWRSSPRSAFRADIRQESAELLARIKAMSRPTGDFFYVNYGAQISSRERGAFAKTKLLTMVQTPGASRCLEGKDILRFQISWRGLWLDYRPDIMYGPRSRELFENPKVLISKTTGSNLKLLASLDEDGYYCDQRVVIVADYKHLEGTGLQTEFRGYRRADTEIRLAFICALYNCRLMSWYFALCHATSNLQGTYSDVVPSAVRALPLRIIDFTTPAADRTRYTETGRRLYEEFCVKADYACVLGFVEHHLAHSQSDVVHDLLAFLAEQMIATNKTKQAEVKGFLAWLGREIGAPIDTLNNKTRVQNYLGDYQKGEPHATLEELLAVLRQNRRKLTADPSRRTFQEHLAAEYAASLDKLLPLKAQLAATDRLIDQVVYRLYGLTEEEVAVVEGKK